MRTSRALALTALLLAGACAPATAGDPAPRPDQGRGGDPGAPTTTTASRTGSPLAAVDPCELLTGPGRAAMAVTGAGQRREQGGARYCQWRVRGDGVADSYLIGVGVWEDSGLDQAVSDRAPRQLAVNSRDAVEGVGVGGASCFVAIAVTESSRVDAAVVGDDGERLCPVARELAQLVEPELP